MLGLVATLKNRIERRLIKRAIKRYIDNPLVTNAFLQRLDTLGAEIIIKLKDHTLRFPANDDIGKKILLTGAYQRDTFELALTLAESMARLNTGGVLLDIGANIGTHTIYGHLSGRFERVIAIEPSSFNYRFLEFNVRENGFETKTSMIRCAAGRVPRLARLFNNPQNCGAASLVNKTSEFELVPVRPTSYILADLSINPNEISMVWTDVEGSELDVLAGMSEIIANSPPLVLEFFSQHFDRTQKSELVQLLEPSYRHLIDLRREQKPKALQDFYHFDRSWTDLLFL